MRPHLLTLLLLALTAVSLGQVVVDQLGSNPVAPRLGATIRYTDPPREGHVYPVNVNQSWGLMNRQGDLVFFPRLDWVDHDYENLVRAVDEHGKTGFLATNGQWRIEPTFAYADRFEEGYAIVGDGLGKFGVIDKGGKLRVPTRLDGALRFREGAAAVMVGDKVGFIDTRGDVLIAPQFRRARSFHDGLAMVEAFPDSGSGRGMLGYMDKGGRWAFRDTAGDFADLGDFHDNFARAQVGQRWGYIDGRFRLRIDAAYEDARDFTQGFAAVKSGGKWGYIDKSGRVVIEPRFDAADDFDDVLAMVTLGGKRGYIDKRGRLLLAVNLAEARPFFRGLARVGRGDAFEYRDTTDRLIWDSAAARVGFINTRSKEDVALTVRKTDRYNRDLPPPAPRPARPEPYPAEHLYVEELPPPGTPPPR